MGPWAGETSRTEALPGISLPDIAQNVLLYIPFGIFGVWVLRGSGYSNRPGSLARRGRIRLQRDDGAPSDALCGRIASPLDVIANVRPAPASAPRRGANRAGLAAGNRSARRTGLLSTPARYVLAAILATIVVAAWYPFDVTLDVSTLSDRTRAIRRDPWLRPSAFELWMQAARFFVLAAVTAFCLPRLARWAAPVAAVVAVLIVVIVDVGQLAMGSQPIGLAAFVSQVAGRSAGPLLAFVVTLVRGT